MAGLLGSAIAGAVGGLAKDRMKQIDAQQAYDLKKALIDAEYEKNIMLKKAGIEIEQQAKQAEMDRRAGYFKDVEETTKTPESVMNKYTDENGNEVVAKSGGEEVTKTRPVTGKEAAERAFKAGDFEAGEGLLKASSTKDKSFQQVKLDDGSIFAFDNTAGTGKVIFEGGGKQDVPKNEYELAYKATGGDPVKMGEYLVSQKARIAAAGRAPKSETETQSRKRDFIAAYGDNPDYVQNGKLTQKGFDKFNKIEGDEDYQTVTEKPITDMNGKPILDKQTGKPVISRSVTRKEKVTPEQSKPKVGRYVPGKGLMYD